MKSRKRNHTILAAALVCTIGAAHAATTITTQIGADADADEFFEFTNPLIPANSSADFANGMAFTLLAGTANGTGNIAELTNGVGQIDSDEPGDSYFASDNRTIRIQMDLGSVMTIEQINTYSRHVSTRTPQDYKVYGATNPTNSAPTYTNAAHLDDAALAALGYTLIADVTRVAGGGIRGVSIDDDVDGILGSYRYILFDMDGAGDGRPVSPSGPGTFFGEIDIYAVPEPTSALLGGLGLLALLRRRR